MPKIDVVSKWEDLKETKLYELKNYSYELSLALKAQTGSVDLPEEAYIYEKNLTAIVNKWDITVDILEDEIVKDMLGPYNPRNIFDEDIIGRFIDFPKDEYSAEELLILISNEFYKDLVTIFPKSSGKVDRDKITETETSGKVERLKSDIVALSSDMSDIEKEDLINYIQKYFGTSGSTVEESTSTLDLESLETIKDIVEEYTDILKITTVPS